MGFNINKDKIDALFKGKDGSENDFKEMYEDVGGKISNNKEINEDN
jgi:hypothetical protein